MSPRRRHKITKNPDYLQQLTGCTSPDALRVCTFQPHVCIFRPGVCTSAQAERRKRRRKTGLVFEAGGECKVQKHQEAAPRAIGTASGTSFRKGHSATMRHQTNLFIWLEEFLTILRSVSLRSQHSPRHSEQGTRGRKSCSPSM